MSVQSRVHPHRTPARAARRAAFRVWLALCLAVPALSGGVMAQNARERGAPAPRDVFDELYDRGQALTASMKTLTARFTETTTSSLLTRPLVASGTLAVERPSRIVLRYTEPEDRTILIDGNRLTTSWPARTIRQSRDIGAAQGRIQRYFVDASSAELRREFDIEARQTSERPGTEQVTMLPRRRQIRESLTRLDLWLDPSSTLLTAMRMTFPTGDTKLMEFEDTTINASLAPGTFAIER